MFSLPDLPYAYNALEPYIDEETMRIHHDKHHAKYIENLNTALSGQDKFLSMDINELMKNLDQIPEEIRTKVQNNGGGHANHSLFWTVMAPDAVQPSENMKEKINASFGSFDNFKKKFSETAQGIFGSGWAWLVVDGDKLVVVTTPNQNSPLLDGKQPILGLDVWEHAYYLKYKNDRAGYINNWFNVVNWQQVEQNLQI